MVVVSAGLPVELLERDYDLCLCATPCEPILARLGSRLLLLHHD